MRASLRMGWAALGAISLVGGLGLTAVAIQRTALVQRAWTFLLQPDRYYARDVWTGTSLHTQVACPQKALVILTGGQSNAGNSIVPRIPANDALPAYQWFDGACYKLQDPLLGTTGSKGSLWAALGQEIARQKPVVFLNTARGATSYRAWLDWRSGYLQNLRDTVDAARAQGLSPTLVLWHQGESDAGRDAQSWVYRRDLGWLMGRVQTAAPEAQIFVYQASRCFSGTSVPALKTAQAQLAQQRAEILLGPDTDAVGSWGRYDGCHFNEAGRHQIVSETLAFLAHNGLVATATD